MCDHVIVHLLVGILNANIIICTKRVMETNVLFVNDSDLERNDTLHSRVKSLVASGHDRVEDDGDVLLLIALSGSKNHQVVLDGGAVEVIQRHRLRRRQRHRIQRRRCLEHIHAR